MKIDLDILSQDPDSASAFAAKLQREGLNARVILSEAEIERDTFLYKFPILVKNTNRNLLLFNLHNSLLPKYRGFHAFCWAIQNGENELGYTIHLVDKRVDAGAILAQEKFTISQALDINDCFSLGGKILDAWLAPTVARILRRELLPTPQNSLGRIYPKKADNNFLTPSATRLEAINLIRAVNPPYGPGVLYHSEKLYRIMLPFGNSSQEALSQFSKGEFSIDLIDGQLLVYQI